MKLKDFVTYARRFRNVLETELVRTEASDTKDRLKLRIEMTNILIQELGCPAYIKKRKTF